MLTIAAAMREEIAIALGLCTGPERLPIRGISGWQASRNGVALHLLRTGMGPNRASLQIGKYLAAHTPSRILLAGYGGALDPALRLGDLVAVRKVSLLGMNCAEGTPLGQMDLEGSWPLAEFLARTMQGAGPRVVTADALTSPFIVGNPIHKEELHKRFGAAVIDMESAVIVRAAASAGIAVSCIRAISDEAAQDFLAPFSYSPRRGAVARAFRVAVAGRWIERYRLWRECSESAARSLRMFLSEYLDRQALEAQVIPSLRSE